jgi:hypothetical protein
MKKSSLLLAVLMIFILAVSASAIDQKGKVAIGAYGGYGFGFGDMFKKYEMGYTDPDLGFIGFSYQNKLTFAAGGKVSYGLTPNLALVGAVDYQGGKVDVKAQAGFLGVTMSDTYHWMAILANIKYVLTPAAKTCPYLTAGGGYYIPNEGDSKPGVNGGVGVEHFFQSNLALDAGARFHMIFTSDKNTTYAQILIGVIYYLGVK